MIRKGAGSIVKAKAVLSRRDGDGRAGRAYPACSRLSDYLHREIEALARPMSSHRLFMVKSVIQAGDRLAKRIRSIITASEKIALATAGKVAKPGCLAPC